MADQPNLFDAKSLTGIGPNTAAARLLDLARAEGTSAELATAANVLVEDWRRLLEVAATAKRVRAGQKQYFRDKTGLTECKQLEAKLDGMLGK